MLVWLRSVFVMSTAILSVTTRSTGAGVQELQRASVGLVFLGWIHLLRDPNRGRFGLSWHQDFLLHVCPENREQKTRERGGLKLSKSLDDYTYTVKLCYSASLLSGRSKRSLEEANGMINVTCFE